MKAIEPLTLVSAVPVEVPVTIDGQSYLLREPDEGAVVQYEDAKAAAARFDASPGSAPKVTGFVGMKATEPLLVSLMLRRVSGAKQYPVALHEVNAMRPSVVSALFAKCREIMDATELTEDDAKN